MRKIDDLLDLKFYMPTECWHVVRYLRYRGSEFTRCWECNDSPGKRRELGSWIIEALHKGDTWNRDIVKEIDESNEKLDQAHDKFREEAAKDAAKDLAPLYRHWEEYGPNADFHYNYAVSGNVKEEKKEGYTVKDSRRIKPESNDILQIGADIESEKIKCTSIN
jgi:hypothetical protein